MKVLVRIFGLVFLGFLLVAGSCKRDINQQENLPSGTSVSTQKILDTTPRFTQVLIDSFFKKYPKYQKLVPEINQLYAEHNYAFLWYKKEGIKNLASLVYDKTATLDEEGINATIPYKKAIDSIFQFNNNNVTDVNTELLLSSMYFFYENKVFRGVDSKKTRQYGWYIPRKGISYVARLDSLLVDSELFDQQRGDVLNQYYKLKEALAKYRQIEKNGGWKNIPYPDSILRKGDYSPIIPKIKARLRATGDLTSHSKTEFFDKALAAAVIRYKKRHAFTANSIITIPLVESMNIPVEKRIETIELNMERCRWMSPNITKAEAVVIVNIPSFNLTFFRNGEPELVSKVVVGKAMNQTAVFSGDMSQIVFSPYWYIPNSIYEKEILPQLLNNENYLEERGMEWYKGRLRQRPGPANALGKVKFIFPNTNAIYLHDTPSKGLFSKEQRAYSHGCIRVERPKDLALSVLKGDSLWTSSKIDEAMNCGEQRTYHLKTKIPVYIGYFTAWVDADGKINFYNDIYERDPILVKLMKD